MHCGVVMYWYIFCFVGFEVYGVTERTLLKWFK